MFVAHILYHICSRRFVVTWVSLAYDDHQKDIFAYMGKCPRQLLSPIVHQVQVLQKLSHKRPVISCPRFPKQVIHVLALAMAREIFLYPSLHVCSNW